MITEDMVNDAKKEFIELIKEMFNKGKNIPPTIGLIVEDPDRTIPGILVFPLPGELFEKPNYEEILKDKVLPMIRQEFVVDKGFKVMAGCTGVEASMIITKKTIIKEDDSIETIKSKGDKTEVLMFIFEDKYNKHVDIFEVETNSYINPEGELKEKKTLVHREDMSFDEEDTHMTHGIFANIFQYFWKPE